MSILSPVNPVTQPAIQTLLDGFMDKPLAKLNTQGNILVIRRNGAVTNYDDSKIANALTKAFNAVLGPHAPHSDAARDKIVQLTKNITAAFKRRMPHGGTLLIEEIQDRVELELMRFEEHKVAREYVIYREERRKAREQHLPTNDYKNNLSVTMPDGNRAPLPEPYLRKIIAEACHGLTAVEPDQIFNATLQNLFDGVELTNVYKAMLMATRPFIEKEYNYSFVTARLLLHESRNEALAFLGMPQDVMQQDMHTMYVVALQKFIARGIEIKRLDQALQQFDLVRLGQALQAERDYKFTYLGLQTLYDRYFIHSDGIRFELPQVFFMRVAMGLALGEANNRDERAIEFYHVLSNFDFMSSTPTLFNAGTVRAQLSSCFLSTVPDDLAGIYNSIKDNALLSKFAGGLGNDWTPVRAMNAHIEGTNGKSQGVVPFLKVVNDTAVAVNQGGKRKGAVCSYLETWHLDIEEFLELRKNTGDERRRTHDMNTANWIPDLFMQRVLEDGEWTLFSPDDVPDLHDLYGLNFTAAYIKYEKKAKSGKIKNYKTIAAKKLWRKMLSLLFETGHPWITFKDPCNLRSPQQHIGVVHSSNLCTEITLNTSATEIAVCNLGSINLVNHLTADGIDQVKLQKTINTAVRMLDNVIDINFYSVPQARHSNMLHRPVGLGIMGFQDALYEMNLSYESPEAIEFADRSMEFISYYAIQASMQLAQERGTYSSYPGSLWQQGILPIDSIEILRRNRSAGQLEMDTTTTLDWQALRTMVLKHGMRNSNVLAIAPTATISNICGISQSIEPTYQNLFVKSNLSGEFTVINPYLIVDLKQLQLWDDMMVNDLKYFDGSIQQIKRIPDLLKKKYKTAFEIDPIILIDAAARRQKWIDQSQSLNLYIAKPSGAKLDQMYRHAWLSGLKTTYYARSLGATNAEKSTIHDKALNAVILNEQVVKVCKIEDETCETCQ